MAPSAYFPYSGLFFFNFVFAPLFYFLLFADSAKVFAPLFYFLFFADSAKGTPMEPDRLPKIDAARPCGHLKKKNEFRGRVGSAEAKNENFHDFP